MTQPAMPQALHDDREALEDAITAMTRPELKTDGAERVHVVLSDELQTKMSNGAAGLACPLFSQSVELKKTLAYRGRHEAGPAILINSSIIGPDYSKFDRLKLCTVVAHEAAHYLATFASMYAAQLWPVELVTEHVTETIAVPPKDWGERLSMPVWYGHDVRFIRGVHHVGFRLMNAGFPIDWYRVMDWLDYGYHSGAAAYGDLLRAEVEQEGAKPLREVLGTPVPKSLMTLWLRDTGSIPTRAG